MPRLLPVLALLALRSLSVADEITITRGPYLQQVAADSIIVCWWTNVESPSVVEYARNGDKPAEIRIDERQRMHAVPLKGLAPATRYTGRVRSGKAVYDVAFKTAPAAKDAPVFFIAYGDTRTNEKPHRRIIEKTASENPDFAVHTGDLVSNGKDPAEWDLFFDIASPLLAKTPFVPSLGNHEFDAMNYYDAFVLPGTEGWYGFDYGPFHFTVLDSNKVDEEGQTKWMIEDLKASKARFKVAVFHHALFAASPIDGNTGVTNYRYKAWGPHFEAQGVKLVLAGHNHNYQRAAHNGITYITTGGGGAPLYPAGRTLLPQTKCAKVVQHYVRVKFDGKKCLLEAVDMDGGAFDSCEVE
jgi:predicted phosphodiesterase